MRKIKFRGRDYNGNFVYGGVNSDGTAITSGYTFVPIEPESLAQFTNFVDGDGDEIYDGDTLKIDFAGAAKIIGDGLLLSTIEATKPTADAKLKVEWSHCRYRLAWRTHNGRVEIGVDLALIDCILPYVEVEAA